MQQFHIQIPPTALYPEASLVFFDILDEVESYAEFLLRDIFNGEEEPLQEGFLIYCGCDYASAVVRLPSSGEIRVFREAEYMDYAEAYGLKDLCEQVELAEVWDEVDSATYSEHADYAESHYDDIPF